KLTALIEKVYDDWASNDLSKSFHEIVDKNIKTARFVSNCALIAYGSITVFTLIKVFGVYLTGSIDERQLITPVYFPWNSQQSPIYELTFISQSIPMLTSLYGEAIIEGQLAILILHACSKVEFVKIRIAELSQSFHENLLDPHSMRLMIKSIYQEHLNFLSFSEDFQDSYSLICLVHVISLTMLMITGSFSVMVAVEKQLYLEALSYALDLISIVLGSCLYCYAGQYLTTQSEGIELEISQCPWYEFPVIHRKSVNLILMRAQVPVAITAGKFTVLSLELFSS
ncbi:hypothetical protein QAD02_016341, partial [Eretmocerus hayati]